MASATLPAAALAQLETAFRAGPWLLDRWSRRRFRHSAGRLLHVAAPGGLVVIGPGTGIEAPSAFAERFEPVLLTGGMDDRSEQLMLLAGSKTTREDRARRVLAVVVTLMAVVLTAGFVIGLLHGMALSALALIGVWVFLMLAVGSLVIWIRRLGGRWFVVPGGVAIIGGPGRHRDELRLFTRHDAAVLLRMIRTGKTHTLSLELVTRGARARRRPVSQREALAFLAAWQSTQPPPTPEQLQELLSNGS